MGGFAGLFATYQFAVSQPVFDLLGRNADFFIAHQAGRWDLLTLAGLVFVAVPALGLLLVRLVPRAPRLFVAGGLLVILLAAIAFPPLHRTGLAPALALAISLLLAGLGFGALARIPQLEGLFRLAAPVTLVFPIALLFFSPARQVLTSEQTEPVGPQVENEDVASVVFVTFDELPLATLLTTEDEIDGLRFPAFAELAADSVWYRNATTVSHVTNVAVPAMLTGLYPAKHRIATVQEYPKNLFTLLGGTHQIHATEVLTRLCPESLCGPRASRGANDTSFASLVRDSSIVYLHALLPSAWTGWLPSIAGTWRDFGGIGRGGRGGIRAIGDSRAAPDPFDPVLAGNRQDEVKESFERFLANLDERPSAPSLHFLHLELPHIPWRFLPSGVEYGPISTSAFAHGVNSEGVWVGTEWELVQGLQRHLAQTMFADRLLGRLILLLKRTSLWDDAVIVITADHGLAFRPGEHGRQPTRSNAMEMASVPLFIRAPGLPVGVVDDRNAETVDIVPTIYKLSGFSTDWPMDGTSLVSTPPRRKNKTLVVDGERWTLSGDSKRARMTGAARIEEIFGRRIDETTLFAIGPHSELVGTDISKLEPIPGSCDLFLEEAWNFDRVGWTPDFLPAHVTGQLRNCDVESGTPIVVAINGNVAVTTEVFLDGDSRRFTALVAPERFQNGLNRIEAFLATQDGTIRSTHDRSSIRYEIVEDGSGVRLVASNGTSASIEPGVVIGELTREGQVFTGWAEDLTGKAQFVVLLVFVDGKLVHSNRSGGFPAVGPTASKAREPDKAGLRFLIPGALIPRHDSRLRVFAVVGPAGSELEILNTDGRR